MQGRLPILALMLAAISGMGTGGCVHRDVHHNAAYLANFQRHLAQQKANSSMTEDRSEALPEMTAEDYVQVGDQYFLQNDLPMAFVQYDKALRLSPERINLKYKQGLIFLKRGLAEDARRAFQDALNMDDTFALAHEGMGQALLMLGHIREAEPYFQQALTLDHKLWKSYNFLGMIYDHQKRFDDAIAAYQAAIAVENNNGSLLNNLGVSLYKKGDYDAAYRTLTSALQTPSADAKTYNNLGLVLAKLGRYQEAIIAFTQGGDQAKAYNNLGVIYLTENKYREAIAAFEQAMALSPRYYTIASDNLRQAQQATRTASPSIDPVSILPTDINPHSTR